MTDVLKLGKKIFTVGVVLTTILWSVGVVGLVPTAKAAVCPSLAAGDMVKVSGKPAIYSVNKDLKVLYFPSGDEFKSWTALSATAANQYAGYTSVTQECFDSLAVPSSYPGGVNYRPGSYVVKRPSSDQLYVVLPGNTKSKVSVDDAKALYGVSFVARTVADPFWPHYVNNGTDIAGKVHEGMLVSKDGKTWYVDAANVLREVTASGMTANRFKASFVRTVAASYLEGTTVGSQITALESAIANRTQDGAVTTIPPVSGGSLSVALAADNPAASNIADGSAYNNILKLNMTAGSAAVKVNGVTLTRTGLIANSNITGVSVWDAQGNRHGDVMTSLTSDNKITISFSGNPILVAAGSSEPLLVKVNISSAAGSGLVGFKVAAATEVATDGTVSGSFPIEGNQMAIIDGNASLASTSIARGSVGGGANESVTANVEVGQKDLEIAKFAFTENSGNEDVVLSQITLYFGGSLQDKDIVNVRVVAPDNTVLGTAAAVKDRYVTVNLTNPYTLPKSTTRNLSVKADIADGSGHTFNVHIQNDYDVLMRGVTTGFATLPASFSDVTSSLGWFKVKAGTLTLNKTASSASGNVSAGASNVVLAKFDVKAVGENMELRKMGIGVDRAGSPATNLSGNLTVRDASTGAVYLTVSGASAALYASATQYNLSSYITINSGETKVLEVVGSVVSTATSGVSYKVQVGNFYAKRFSSLDFQDNLPSSGNTSTDANQLTVSATSLTCYRDTSMGNVTRAPGATAVIGQYVCTAGTSEDVRLTGMTFTFGNTGSAANSFQNVSLWDGSTQLGSTLSTVASTSNAFTMDLTVAKNATKTFQLKGYVVPTASGSVSSSIATYNYTGKDSSNASSGSNVYGQSVTMTAGTLAISAVSDATTISRVYASGATGVQLGKWKFEASNDNVTLSKLSLTSGYSISGDATTIGTYGSMSLYDGSTKLGDATWVNGDVVFTGFSLTIPVDSYKILTLKGNINSSGVSSANTTTAFSVKSASNTDLEARSGAGALLAATSINDSAGADLGSRGATSTYYMVHDSYPTVTAGSVGTSLSLGTTVQILKFTITNSGSRELRFGSSTVAISVSGLVGGTVESAASGTVRGFRLYEDNGSGGLGTRIAGGTTNDTADVKFSTSSAATQNVTFDPTNDASSLLDNFRIEPGASRTLIVTADTSNMLSTKTTGSVVISAKISGSTGWSGSVWNAGNLFYYYTPVGGSENTVPYSASDSYDVQGGTMSYTL